jgi:hypothetical protein
MWKGCLSGDIPGGSERELCPFINTVYLKVVWLVTFPCAMSGLGLMVDLGKQTSRVPHKILPEDYSIQVLSSVIVSFALLWYCPDHPSRWGQTPVSPFSESVRRKDSKGG